MKFSLYGLPQFAISTTEVFLRLYLLIYLTNYLNFTGIQGGLIISGSLIVSAIFDPFIGQIVDKAKALKGKVTGIILVALGSICLFLSLIFIPAWDPSQFTLVFLLVLGYQISYSSFLIPYLALAKELINEEDDIVSLYAWRYFFGSIGSLIAVSLPFLQDYYKTDSYQPIAISMVGLIIILAPGSLLMLKEKKNTQPLVKSEQKVLLKLKDLIKDKVFFGYYLTFTVLSIGLGVNQTLAIYYYKNGLQLTDSETNVLLAVYMVVLCLSIPFWVAIAKKKGKKLCLSIGLAVITAVTLVYPFLPARNFLALYTLIVFAGLFTGIVALIDSYLSNIIDFHTYKKKEKRANLIFGVWRISDKLSRALGIYIAGVLLDLTINKQDSLFNIKEAFGYGVFIFLFPATLIFLAQRYSDSHHEKVIRILKRKNPDLLYKAEELES